MASLILHAWTGYCHSQGAGDLQTILQHKWNHRTSQQNTIPRISWRHLSNERQGNLRRLDLTNWRGPNGTCSDLGDWQEITVKNTGRTSIAAKGLAVRIPSASAREDSLKPRDLCSLRSFFLRLNKQETPRNPQKHAGNGQPS